MDNTIKKQEDVEKFFGLPVLGQIPLDKESVTKGGQGAKVSSIVKPSSFAAEAYRSLRTNIQFINFENQAKTILVTSPTAGEGKTTVSVNLAATLAMTGAKVLLLDCDLRNPKVHQRMEIDNGVGLSSVLIKSSGVEAATRKIENQELYIITSGPQPPNPSELLGSARMAEFLKAAGEKFDYIVIDTPPVCVVTDASVLASRVDGILLVSSFDSTTKEAAVESRRILDKFQKKLIGVVVNKIDIHKKSGSRYGYYGRYGYGYGYGYGHSKYYGDYRGEQKAG